MYWALLITKHWAGCVRYNDIRGGIRARSCASRSSWAGRGQGEQKTSRKMLGGEAEGKENADPTCHLAS